MRWDRCGGSEGDLSHTRQLKVYGKLGDNGFPWGRPRNGEDLIPTVYAHSCHPGAGPRILQIPMFILDDLDDEAVLRKEVGLE